MLKKLIPAVFIALVLLNVLGYYGIFVGLQYANTREMIHQFDADVYNRDDAQNLKIPFPSAHSSEMFERVDGEFEKDGEVFRLIKQRLYRDTFHIVYMKDKTATALKKSIERYTQSFCEQTQDESQPTVLPIFIREYFSSQFFIEEQSPGYQCQVRKEAHTSVFIDSFMSSIIHPPERV